MCYNHIQEKGQMYKHYDYRTRTIISHGLYFFKPFFHCGLYLRVAYTAERFIFLFHFLTDLQRPISRKLSWNNNFDFTSVWLSFSLTLLQFDFTSVWFYFSLILLLFDFTSVWFYFSLIILQFKMLRLMLQSILYFYFTFLKLKILGL